jgi:hypothetical protein
VGVEGSLVLDAAYGQSWHVNRDDVQQWQDGIFRRIQSRQETERWSYAYFVRVGLRTGYGRVRDATGVFQALLLAERLERDRLLAQPLSDAARARLAALFYRASDYGIVHDLPAKVFWRDVERILVEDGALAAAGLDAFATLHGLDPVGPIADFRRAAGWFVGPALEYAHENTFERATNRSRHRAEEDGVILTDVETFASLRPERASDRLLAGFAAQLHRPLGPRTQLDLTGRAMFDVENADLATQAEAQGAFGHLVGERWFASGQLGYLRRIERELFQADEWRMDFRTGFDYYLEDRWRLGLSAFGLYVAAPGVSGHTRILGVQLGLGYGSASAEAPGLADPLRPLN